MDSIFCQRLDRPNKVGRATVFGALPWAGGHRRKVPTGVMVRPQHWPPAKAKRIHTSAQRRKAGPLALTCRNMPGRGEG